MFLCKIIIQQMISNIVPYLNVTKWCYNFSFHLRFLGKIYHLHSISISFSPRNPLTKIQYRRLHLPPAIAKWRSIKEILNQISISLNRWSPFGMFNFLHKTRFSVSIYQLCIERLLALINGLIWCWFSV